MITLKSTRILYVDVDSTLIRWDRWNEDTRYSYAIESKFDTDDEEKEARNIMSVCLETVRIMKQHKERGHSVVVWSAGGAEWAEYAVKSLGLEPLVDLVISKPDWFIDDLQSHDFMPDKIRHNANKFPRNNKN